MKYYKSLPGIVAGNLTSMALTGGMSGLAVILLLFMEYIICSLISKRNWLLKKHISNEEIQMDIMDGFNSDEEKFNHRRDDSSSDEEKLND